MIEADKKREQIVEGAIKRFIHFGINKTTMNDIAEDLSVSKPSLYYYFPDKKSLIAGVIEKIFNDYFSMLTEKYSPKKNIEDILNQIIEIRDFFFRKYFMLKITEGLPDLIAGDETIKNLLNNLKSTEQKFFTDVFKNAKEKNEIDYANMPEVAELYLESMVGFTTICVMHTKKDLFPEEKMLKDLRKKQKELSRIFIRGLKPVNN